MKTIDYEVKNPLGIHARPAAILAQACTDFKSTVTVECNGETAAGNNVLQILALHAAKGCTLKITVDGEDEDTERNSAERYDRENTESCLLWYKGI